jgi:hypothetical protein
VNYLFFPQFPPKPRKSVPDKAVPANMVCGVFDEMDEKTLKAVKASGKN